MIEYYISVMCDNCGLTSNFRKIPKIDVYRIIRNNDWAVSKNRKYTFCPKCKIKMMNVGRNGYNKLTPFGAEPDRFIKIRDLFLSKEAEKMCKINEEKRAEFARLNGD